MGIWQKMKAYARMVYSIILTDKMKCYILDRT